MELSCHCQPTSCSSKPTGSEWFRGKTKARVPIACHTALSDSDAMRPWQRFPFKERPAQAEVCFPEMYSVSPQNPIYHASASHSLCTHLIAFTGHLAQLTSFSEETEFGSWRHGHWPMGNLARRSCGRHYAGFTKIRPCGHRVKCMRAPDWGASEPQTHLAMPCARTGALSPDLRKVVTWASGGSSVQVDECGQTPVVCKDKNVGNGQQWWETCSSREKERGRCCLCSESIRCFAPVSVTTSSTSCPRLVGDAPLSFWEAPWISFN